LYSTSSQNPSITVPDLNFLTDALSEDRIYVDARIFSLEVLLLDLSVTNHCGASEAYAPIHNLITYCQILFLDEVSNQDLEQNLPFMADFFFPWSFESFSLKTLVIYRLIKSS
jgi:hypothetical protein